MSDYVCYLPFPRACTSCVFLLFPRAIPKHVLFAVLKSSKTSCQCVICCSKAFLDCVIFAVSKSPS